MSEPDAIPPQTKDESAPLPPPTFSVLVLSLRTQAEVYLGLIRVGEEAGRAAADLPAARHAIDMLAMLQEKTRGNLTLEEQRLIDNSLTELRFRYVQAVEEQARETPA